MIKLILSLSLFLFFTGCDFKQPPKEVDLDTIYDTLPLSEDMNNYPYTKKFKYVLDNSLYEKYSNTNIDINSSFNSIYFSDTFNRNLFYLDSELNLVFSLNKQKKSPKIASQLIQKKSWHTSDYPGNYLISMVKCYKPQEINSYTWMQIHGLEKKDANESIYYDYPLVKLTWERNMKNEYDHIWAVVTKSSPGVDEPKIYEWIDLGARPENTFSAELHIHKNILEIKIEYSTKSIQNVSYWKNVPSYFKAGIFIDSYLDGGEAAVSFSELRFENNESNVDNITHF